MRRITKLLSVPAGIWLVLLLACASAAAQAPPAAWELSPYRIKLIVAVEPGGEISSRFEQDLATDLVARAAAAVGGSWRIDILPPPAELRHKMLASLGTIAADALPAAALDSDRW